MADRSVDDWLVVGTPIYLIKSWNPYYRCGSVEPVVALASRNIGKVPGDDMCILSNIQEMPEEILRFIQSVHPYFEERYSRMAELHYYMNICSVCGAHFGDFFLHSEPGGAFFPTCAEEVSEMSVRTLPFEGQYRFVSSFGVGIGDLIFKHAKREDAEQPGGH